MDTQFDVPQFKLAKIGGRRERKKGALPFWLGAGGGSGAGVAAGGAGLVAKTMVALVLTTLGVGAYNVGKSLAPQESALLRKPRPFSSSQRNATPQNVPGLPTEQAAPSGLSMVSGSLDGLTPEQRAAQIAEAEAAAKAEAERQAAADAAAANGAPQVAGAPPGGIDAAALAAAAAQGAPGAPGEDKKNAGPFKSRFGQLSTLGGGNPSLAGGAGMSGGVGRTFDAPKLGSAKGFGSTPTPARTTARATAASSRGRTRSFKQLYNAYNQSQGAVTAPGLETAATSADAPFSNNPGANNAITGGGAGTAATTGGGAGAGTTNPIGGGPTGGSESSGGGNVATPGHRDATPWGGMVKMASGLLLIASILLAVGTALKGFDWFSGMIRTVIGYAVAALAGIAAFLGMAIMGAGGQMQGLMYMVGGGIVALGGVMLAVSPKAGKDMLTGFTGTWAMYGGYISALLGGTIGLSGMSAKNN